MNEIMKFIGDHVNMDRAYTTELWMYIMVALLGLLLYSLSHYFKIVILALKMPGPPVVPLIGNCLMIKERDLLYEQAAKSYITYGPIARIWIMLYPVFVVLEPHDLQTVLSSKKHTDKIFFYKLLHNFLGNGLITSSGEKWSLHRKLLQPSFHLSVLEKFCETFTDSAQNFTERLSRSPKTINITQYVNDCVLDILNEAVLGIPVLRKSVDKIEESPFRQGKVVVPYRVTRPWLLLDFIYKMTETAASELNQKHKLVNFTRKVIDQRRRMKLNGEPIDRKCLLDHMIELSENYKHFNEDDIVNEACTFMLAGQDSVGAGIAFCLFLLAQNPDDQQKCFNEIHEIFGDEDRRPTMNDLREMRYTEQCIKETLRLYPSVPLLARKITEDIEVSKYKIPAGSEIFIVPYATHRIPHIYPDPERFDPTRFSSENVEKRHPYAFIPFSAGPRNCIGHKFAILEMKIVISKMLRQFKLLPVPGRTKIEPSFRITVRARGGLWIKLEPRTTC